MFEKMKNIIENREGLDRFTRGYEDYGAVVTPDGGVRCREWSPNARALYLQGDFSKMLYNNKKNVYLRPYSIIANDILDGSAPRGIQRR